ncbi:DHH family phosphoesterase, partial [candidate division KSB1 bacterium]|nr:DHH family phosphoesterase [candidate division KSB1 bacterium]
MRVRDWSVFHAFLRDKERILITTHRNPDGDAIGSEIALMHFLRQQGKTVHVINSDPTPKFFRFLDPEQEIGVYDPASFAGLLPRLHGGIVVDINDWARLADIGRAVQTHGLPLACIDHHIPTDHLGDVQVVDTRSSSTGELIFDLIDRSNGQWNQNVVDALYTCILTDTGSFRFSNTTPKTHRNAARLLSLGARFRQVYRQVYESYSANRIHLAGRLMADMRFDCDGR